MPSMHHKKMQNTNSKNVDNTAPIASATVPEDPWSVPKEVSAFFGDLLDETAESTKSFVTSVGDQLDKTADFVKGVFPSTADKDPANKEVSAAPEEKKT